MVYVPNPDSEPNRRTPKSQWLVHFYAKVHQNPFSMMMMIMIIMGLVFVGDSDRQTTVYLAIGKYIIRPIHNNDR